MDQLWAPWRLSYVTQPAKPKAADDCFVCRGLAESDDRANLIAERTGSSVVVLNRFPYNTGHLLVAPTAHKAGLDDLSDDESLDLQRTIRRMVGALKSLLKPDGFNVGLNLGEAAGAGLPGHLHWHVVPRWAGDTNFMPVLADVKVMVQSLDVFWDRLRDQLKKG
ncbi:MAG: HIT domain-containing protein [Gemmataceae bacterium]